MTLNELEKADARGQIFQMVSFIMLALLDLEEPNSVVWRGVFLGVSPAPPQGAGPQCSPIWGFLLFKRTPFNAQRPNLM